MLDLITYSIVTKIKMCFFRSSINPKVLPIDNLIGRFSLENRHNFLNINDSLFLVNATGYIKFDGFQLQVHIILKFMKNEVLIC